MLTSAKRAATASSPCTSPTSSTSSRWTRRRNRNGYAGNLVYERTYDYQLACGLDSGARDRVFGGSEAHVQSECCRGDVEGLSRTLSSTARCDGNCIRGAVCRASHDETRVYSRVLLLCRCDRDRAVARSFEGQSVYPDRTALDRRFHSGSLDFFCYEIE